MEQMSVAQNILSQLSDGAILCDLHGRVIYANEAAYNIFETDPSAFTHVNQVIPQTKQTTHSQNIDTFNLTKHHAVKMSKRPLLTAVTFNQNLIDVNISISQLSIDNLSFNLAIIKDMSVFTKKLDDANDAAQTDFLTGLKNRLYLSEMLNLTIAKRSPFALIMMDLNKFKPVNDNLGHNIGDEVLKELATRLLNHVRSSDIVARVGGDEFVIILKKIRDRSKVMELSMAINKVIQEPMLIEDHKIKIGAAMGICLFPEHAITAHELLEFADKAMYKAKTQKVPVLFYDSISAEE